MPLNKETKPNLSLKYVIIYDIANMREMDSIFMHKIIFENI